MKGWIQHAAVVFEGMGVTLNVASGGPDFLQLFKFSEGFDVRSVLRDLFIAATQCRVSLFSHIVIGAPENNKTETILHSYLPGACRNDCERECEIISRVDDAATGCDA